MNDNKNLIGLLIIAILGVGAWMFLGKGASANEVVVYTAHDQDYSEPILQGFEEETGIKVKPVFDVEATKTTGLVNRLLAEQGSAKADVFWNNEVSRSEILKREGVLQAYKSPNAVGIPAQHQDPQGYWTGFGARARVLVVNTDLLSEDEYPQTLEELTQEGWRGKVTIANPLFGSTASHVASLYTVWGEEKAEQYLRDLKANDVVIAEGNGQTRDMVADGEVPVGFTDTDDANDAVVDGKPVAVIYPDQGKDQIGALVFPNTVMLIKDAPNKENAKKLIDYLLSPEVERELAKSKAAQMPLHPNVWEGRDDKPENVPDVSEIKAMDVTWDTITNVLEQSQKFVQEEFVQ